MQSDPVWSVESLIRGVILSRAHFVGRQTGRRPPPSRIRREQLYSALKGRGRHRPPLRRPSRSRGCDRSRFPPNSQATLTPPMHIVRKLRLFWTRTYSRRRSTANARSMDAYEKGQCCFTFAPDQFEGNSLAQDSCPSPRGGGEVGKFPFCVRGVLPEHSGGCTLKTRCVPLRRND